MHVRINCLIYLYSHRSPPMGSFSLENSNTYSITFSNSFIASNISFLSRSSLKCRYANLATPADIFK